MRVKEIIYGGFCAGSYDGTHEANATHSMIFSGLGVNLWRLTPTHRFIFNIARTLGGLLAASGAGGLKYR